MLLVRLFFISVGALLAACSTPSSSQVAALPVEVSCKSAEGIALPEMSTIVALRRNVEMGPLYTVPAVAAGVAECHIGYESGVIALEYRFRDGGWLRVKRDASIEYTEQEARFALPPTEHAVPILARAERTAFGISGCGINWQQTETLPVIDDTGTKETVFRGDVCNCQARIRHDNVGRVIGLVLRSAC